MISRFKRFIYCSVIIYCLFFVVWAFALDEDIIKVGLKRLKESKELSFTTNKGGELYVDKKLLLKSPQKIKLSVTRGFDKVIILSFSTKDKNGKFYGKELVFSPYSEVTIENPSKGIKKYYEGSFTVNNTDETLFVVNQISIRQYLESVVAWEIGSQSAIEALNSQAIVARTFLLKNLSKHKKENYNVCDSRVACCQVYNGTHFFYNKKVKESIEQTRDEILTYNNEVIDALFHSCCGGRTTGIESSWPDKSGLPYLQPIEDVNENRESYCARDNRFEWKCEFPISIAVKPFGIFFVFNKEIKLIKNSFGDVLYLEFGNDKLNVLEYRRRLGYLGYKGINSNFFSIEREGDKIIFYGKGFGHRVGMCQSGAKEMAKQGKNYKEILFHYYKNVRLKKQSSTERREMSCKVY